MNRISHHAFVGMRADDDATLPERIAPPVDIVLRPSAEGSAAPLLEDGSEPLLAAVRRDRVFVPLLIVSAAVHIAVAAAFGLYDRPRVGMEGGQEIPVEIVVETIDHSPGVDDVSVDLPTPDLPPEPVFPPELVQVAEAPKPVELPLPEPPPPLALSEPEPPPPEPEPPVQVAEATRPVELPAPEPPPQLVLPEPQPSPPVPEPPVKVAEAPAPVELPPPEVPPPLALPEPDPLPPPQRVAEVQLPDVEVPPPEPPPPLFLPKPDEPPAPVQMVEAGPVVPPPAPDPPPPAKVEPPRPPQPDLAARREQERRKATEDARRKQEQQARQEKARQEAQARREAQQKVAAAAAPRPAAASAGDIANFKSRVAGKLASSKRYPDAARSRGATGVAVVSFRIDASGNPSGISLAKSSGQADLDAETLAMVRRAAPFPAPPQGAPTSFSVPINYNLR